MEEREIREEREFFDERALQISVVEVDGGHHFAGGVAHVVDGVGAENALVGADIGAIPGGGNLERVVCDGGFPGLEGGVGGGELGGGGGGRVDSTANPDTSGADADASADNDSGSSDDDGEEECDEAEIIVLHVLS